MNRTKYILFFFLFTFQALGQENLILNGGFEEYWQCPDDATQIERCKYVYNPCASAPSTSDYFNACFTTGMGAPVGVPNTSNGYQNSRNGDGMAGYGCIDSPGFQYREYIQLSLSKPLECGKKYLIEGYFNLSDLYRYSIKNIGFLFSEDRINYNHFLYENYIPQYTDSLTLISDTVNWIKISFEYIADAPHQFLTIGNFLKDSTESYVEVNPNGIAQQYSCYFFLDDLSLKEIAETSIQFPNIFTPNNDGINDFIDLSEFSEFSILNRWGEEVFNDSNTKMWRGENNQGDWLSEGVYFVVAHFGNCPEKNHFSKPITIIR